MNHYGIVFLSVSQWALGLFLFWGLVFLIQFTRSGNSPHRAITEKDLKRLEMEEAEEKERMKYEDDYNECLSHATEKELEECLGRPDQKQTEPAIDWEEESKKEKEEYTFLPGEFFHVWSPKDFNMLSHYEKIKMFYQEGSLWSRYEECGYVYECRSIRYHLFTWCEINPATKEYFNFVADDGSAIPTRFWEVRMASLKKKEHRFV